MTVKAVGCSLNFKNPAQPDYYLVVRSEKVIALHLEAMTFLRGIPHSRKVLILITYPPVAPENFRIRKGMRGGRFGNNYRGRFRQVRRERE